MRIPVVNLAQEVDVYRDEIGSQPPAVLAVNNFLDR